MIAAYLAAMRRYVCFAGRASRGEYWWYHLSLITLLLAAWGVDSVAFADPESTGTPLTSLVLLAHGLPSLAVGVRRLHDMDRSGWFWLVGLIPLVGPVVLLVWYCQPGTLGANRFGPDPLAAPVDVLSRRGRPLATTARDVVAEIERLAGLQAAGMVSEAEFQLLKAQVVAGTARA